MGEMLDTMKGALNANAKFTWVPADFLEAQRVAPWSDMPVWLPPQSEEGGGNQVSNKRALGKGLTFRPLADTTRDTVAWFKKLPQDRQSKMKAGLTAERETEVLAAWHKKQS
jgi:2'-hydroxyisoflavone reductase